MKAVLCKQLGRPELLVLEETASPSAGSGQVVISVKACALSFPDTLLIQGKYQFKPSLPFSPGGEVAGVVREVGEDVQSVRPGDRVVAFTTSGGFAEEVLVDASRVISLPEKLDFATAAALIMTYATS